MFVIRASEQGDVKFRNNLCAIFYRSGRLSLPIGIGKYFALSEEKPPWDLLLDALVHVLIRGRKQSNPGIKDFYRPAIKSWLILLCYFKSSSKKHLVKSPLRLLAVAFMITVFAKCSEQNNFSGLDHNIFAKQYYGEDNQWYLNNIPFFECSDKEMEQVYYYRWKLYKAHIRNTGPDKYIITEFINHVPWDRDPYCTINAASMHHIYEGRWLTDACYMNGYINYLCREGGNNRRYSESIADAAYAYYLVNGDRNFIVAQLDSMKQTYDQWIDHWDSSKNLYYIPAMPDATEYTIASIDASGGKDGFEGGEAFRPTINSYMYGNAMAISKIAALSGDQATSREYLERAQALKANVQQNLWNDSLQHFTDRFKVNNNYVKYWDFIRGRELAGFAPWYFNLPDDSPQFNSAWKHLTDTSQLLGKFGFRTNEPSYEYYFKQFVYFEGKRGSQWNGPSWPYQSSQALTAMANLLNNYKQDIVTNSDYLHSLRLFTKQHYLPDGNINLVENYDPNIGGPIVYYYWSNHYLHSSYNNLIISGLCGIRPTEGDSLYINPLIDTTIKYFCISGVNYRGHKLTVAYDETGTKYHSGKGLMIYVDGKRVSPTMEGSKYKISIGSFSARYTSKSSENFALNIEGKGFPQPSSSVNAVPDSIFQAVDGRTWYFPEIRNRWSTLGSLSSSDWLAIDFGQPRVISEVRIYPFVDSTPFGIPDDVSIDFKNDKEWVPITISQRIPEKILANTGNRLLFEKVNARIIRINFRHTSKQIAMSEVECY